MDRFIGAVVMSFTYLFVYLKSNMDRFIDLSNEEHHYRVKHLKSNMDRFIVRLSIDLECIRSIFKIQYG